MLPSPRQYASSTSPLADQLLEGAVSSSRDVFDVLFRAATHPDSDKANDSSRPPSFDHEMASVRTDRSGHRSSIPPSDDLCRHWRRYRFVVQGWFAAREAVLYIDQFAKKLAKISPACGLLNFDGKMHEQLVHEEPLLCCTLLMISTRFHLLPGQTERARTDYIHTRLWRHCEHLIQRIKFGLEKYSTAKTRTLGSIYALLLITEWHPRALYFPPETEGWDTGLALSFENSFERDEDFHASQHMTWRENVFEPVKRSDRMSWVLLGIALTLAHELGVFSPNTENPDPRHQHVRQLLYIYVSQQSLRSECTAPTIEYTTGLADDPTGKRSNQLQIKHQQHFKFLSSWLNITKIMKLSNDMLFTRYKSVQHVVTSGQYTSIIDHFQSLLEQWYRDSGPLDEPRVKSASEICLLVDYHYCRMFVHSVAMQAVIERGKSASAGAGYWLDCSQENDRDMKSIQQVREASCAILQICMEMAESDELRFCSTRVMQRIVSAAIFLLKSISFGASQSKVDSSLALLQKCTAVLQEQRQDDLHLSGRFGHLIDRHIWGFRAKFVTQGFRPYMGMELNHASGNGIEMGDASDNFITEDWLAQPFDTSIAPFSFDSGTFSSGFGIDSLDFLLNTEVNF